MLKDKDKEDKKEEEEEKEEKDKTTWFQKVPARWKIAAAGVLFFKYQSVVSKGGNLQELWMWAIAAVAILYFMGSEGQKFESKILTPEEAEESLEKEIKRKIKKGQIPRWTKWYIGPNNGLKFNEAMPQHYSIGVTLIDDDKPRYKKGIVIAEGEAKGYATIQNNPGEFQGYEDISIGRPAWMKDIKKHDLDVKDFLFMGPAGKK